jgi:hypothetical protein
MQPQKKSQEFPISYSLSQRSKILQSFAVSAEDRKLQLLSLALVDYNMCHAPPATDLELCQVSYCGEENNAE